MGLAILFCVFEAVTVQLVSVWFAGGALCALLSSFLGANSVVQVVVFVISSAALLALTRPLAKKMTNGRKVATNADSLIGKTAVITKKTDDLGLSGEAKVAGSIWTVCSDDGLPLNEQEKVKVDRIEGVKLIVKR